MEILIDALLVIVALFFVVNYTKNKAMELVILLSCGVLAKTIFATIEVNQLISEIALGLAMLGIGLGVSPKALADSGKTAILLIILQFAIGAGIFFWGGDWKPLGIALLFQSTPLVVEITNRSTTETRSAMLGLMALQDASSGILAAMAGGGGGIRTGNNDHRRLCVSRYHHIPVSRKGL